MPSLIALEKRIAEMERIANARRNDTGDVTYCNDPEEGLDEYRVDDEGETIEIGDGKPQPVVTLATLEAMIEERRAESRLQVNLLSRDELPAQNLAQNLAQNHKRDSVAQNPKEASMGMTDAERRNPSSAPPAPGSKLASMKALGGGRFNGVDASPVEPAPKPAASPLARRPVAKRAVVAKPAPKAASKPAKPAKGGRPKVIDGEPWRAEGVSKRTWYRRQKAAQP
jgi:hypothetical protein